MCSSKDEIWILKSAVFASSAPIRDSWSLRDNREEIDSHPRRIVASYNIPLELAQKTGQNIDMVQICAAMWSDDWMSDAISIPMRVKQGEKRMKPKKSLRNNTEKTTGVGVSARQFHKLLVKTSQPIKESEKEKSQT